MITNQIMWGQDSNNTLQKLCIVAKAACAAASYIFTKYNANATGCSLVSAFNQDARPKFFYVA